MEENVASIGKIDYCPGSNRILPDTGLPLHILKDEPLDFEKYDLVCICSNNFSVPLGYTGSIIIGDNVIVNPIEFIKKFDGKKITVSKNVRVVTYLQKFLDEAIASVGKNTLHGVIPDLNGLILMGDIFNSHFESSLKIIIKFQENLLEMYSKEYDYNISFSEVEKKQIKWFSALKSLQKKNNFEFCFNSSYLIISEMEIGKKILVIGDAKDIH